MQDRKVAANKNRKTPKNVVRRLFICHVQSYNVQPSESTFNPSLRSNCTAPEDQFQVLATAIEDINGLGKHHASTGKLASPQKRPCASTQVLNHIYIMYI